MKLDERLITGIKTFFGKEPRIELFSHILEYKGDELIPVSNEIFSIESSSTKVKHRKEISEQEHNKKQETIKLLGRVPFLNKTDEILPYGLTYAISSHKAVELSHHIKEEFPLVNARILGYNNSYSVFVSGDITSIKSIEKKFKQFSIAGIFKGSIMDSIKQQINFPYGFLEPLQLNKNSYSMLSKQQLSMNEFISLKKYSFDDEFMFWWKPSANITSLKSSDKEIISFLENLTEYDIYKEQDKNFFKKKNREELLGYVQKYFCENVGDRNKNLHKQPLSLQLATQHKRPDGFLEDVVYYFNHLTGTSGVKEFTLTTGPATIVSTKCSSPLEMLIKRQEFFHSHPAIILVSQNGMGYDLLEEKKFLEEEKKNASRKDKKHIPNLEFFGEGPKISPAGFFSRVNVSSIIHFDFAPYSQNHFPFTIDNKLTTVMSLVLGKQFKKTQTYQDQLENIVDEIILKKEISLQEKVYGCEDTTILNHAFNVIAPVVYLQAKLFGCGVEQVCCTSTKRLGLQKYLFDMTAQKSSSHFFNKKEEYDNFNSFLEFSKDLNEFRKEPIIKNIKKEKDEGSLYYLLPFTRLYVDRLRKDNNIQEIFKYVNDLNISPLEYSTQKTLSRFVLLQSIEEAYVLPFVFEQYENNFKYWRKQKEEVMSKYDNLFSTFAPINSSDNFVIFKKEDAQKKEFIEHMKGLGCKVSEGEVVNFSNSSFALFDGVNIFKKGIDVLGNRGFKTEYEKELIRTIIDKGFNGGEEQALHVMNGFLKDLNSEKLNKEKMLFFIETISRDYDLFSSKAQSQERVKEIIRDNLNKGEQFIKGKLHNGWYSAKEFLNLNDSQLYSTMNKEFFIDMYLGPRGKKNTRLLTQSKVGKILLPFINSYCLKNNYSKEEVITKLSRGVLF